MRSLLFAAALLSPLTAFAGPMWDGLTPAQKQSILNGESVTVTTDANSILSVTTYVWMKHLGPKADPEGAAAIYWDFANQPSFLAPAGVKAYDVVAPYGVSSKNIDVVLTIPGLPEVSYTAEATAYRTGNKAYSIRWHAPKFDVQPAPGLRETHGSMDLESFPGDQGGALLAQTATAILADAVANDPAYKAATIDFHIFMTSLFKQRFEQGPNLLQLLAFKAAVFAW